MTVYEQRALQWCEHYGVVEYKLNKNVLEYNVSYPVNLDTMQETTKQLKRYDPKGVYNR